MDSKRSSKVTVIVILLIIVAWPTAIYVLSIGPAVLLVDYGIMSLRTFSWLYGPLVWLATITGLVSVLKEYADLWQGWR